MIRFSLLCDDGHRFDAWFAGSAAFDSQRDKGLVPCPVCGSIRVDKSLMAPAVSTTRRRDQVPLAANVGEEPEAAAALRRLRQHLTRDAEYVGGRFAEEARRIHYDEVEKRGIYGEASVDEVRALAEDGIEFHPLPVLPEEHN